MRLTVVTRSLPRPGVNGPALSLWTILQEAKGTGHDVSLVVLDTPSPHREEALDLAPLRSTGIEVSVYVPDTPPPGRGRLARFLRPRLSDLYPLAGLTEEIGGAVRQTRPDVVLAYEAWVVAALGDVDTPVVAITVDLDHLPGWMRFRRTRIRPSIAYAREVSVAVRDRVARPRALVRLLAGCDAVVNYAAHHAAWLRARGVRCSYLPTPILDPGHAPRTGDDEAPVRIMMVGHLRGTATRAGLELFVAAVLPGLRQALGPEGFRVRIVGAFPDALPPELARSLDAPEVTLTGYVDDIGLEFRTAHVVLVPTPIELGTRVRILVAFSYGCCVIAHEANARGIPELRDSDNVLLGSGGPGLVEAILRAARDPGLRERLRISARQTYEERFAPGVAGAALLEVVDRAYRRSG